MSRSFQVHEVPARQQRPQRAGQTETGFRLLAVGRRNVEGTGHSFDGLPSLYSLEGLRSLSFDEITVRKA